METVSEEVDHKIPQSCKRTKKLKRTRKSVYTHLVNNMVLRLMTKSEKN